MGRSPGDLVCSSLLCHKLSFKKCSSPREEAHFSCRTGANTLVEQFVGTGEVCPIGGRMKQNIDGPEIAKHCSGLTRREFVQVAISATAVAGAASATWAAETKNGDM